MSDIEDTSSSRRYPPRKRTRVYSDLEFVEVSSSGEDTDESKDVIQEANTTKKKHKGAEQGNERYMPCGPCVSRASTTPGQKCYNQVGVGVACSQCAKHGHNKACIPVPPHLQSELMAWWDQNRIKKEDEIRTPTFMTELNDIIRQIRAYKRDKARLPLSTASEPTPAFQQMWSTLPRADSNIDTIGEKEYDVGKFEALESIASSTAKIAESLGFLVKNTDEIKDSLRQLASRDTGVEDEESSSSDSEEEENSSSSLSPSSDEKPSSSIQNRRRSLVPERHNTSDRPLISIADRDALLALAIARDDGISGLLQRTYAAASTSDHKERGRRDSKRRAGQKRKRS
ncbi:hypothetical protein B0T20DRAFT_456105 [Sordaria brevicollis]|uniref:Uncharacterized protein n=1 Tax=Sordaria brevicollis TaxID=83679 RepID=A0AAE0P3Q1_SORBR|nr:hypothetical protein B0T20DRAFT_456105 [Sordaria brevicollis]